MDREIPRLLKRLKKALAAQGVVVSRFVLFGSCVAARGRRKDSDVDVVAISDDFARLDTFKRFETVGIACARGGITTPTDILPFTEREYQESAKGTFIGDEVKPKGVEIIG